MPITLLDVILLGVMLVERAGRVTELEERDLAPVEGLAVGGGEALLDPLVARAAQRMVGAPDRFAPEPRSTARQPEADTSSRWRATSART